MTIEDGLWEMIVRLYLEIVYKNEYLRINTDIKPFQEKTILKSKNLSEL